MPDRPDRLGDLGAEFAALAEEPLAQRRGYSFERLTHRVFEAHGFEVERKPRSARPRETDIYVARDDEYLVETRYRKTPVGSDAIDDLRVRLNRTASHILGLYVSVGGFRQEAIQAV